MSTITNVRNWTAPRLERRWALERRRCSAMCAAAIIFAALCLCLAAASVLP